MAIKDLIENGYIVVLDTNVLLNVYRYSPEFSDFALKCLNAIKDKIILPATVRLEYENHRHREFSIMEKRTKEASKETEKQIEIAKNKIINSCCHLERLHFQDVDELKNNLSNKIDEVQKVLDNYYEDHAALDLIQHSWNGIDYIRNFVLDIDSNGQVMISPSQEDIYRWCDEGEERYKKEIPPGYEDAKNKDGVRKYSDFIIWREILRYAQNESVNIIFITNDVKADWWEEVNEKKQFHSKLIEEFSKTGYHIVAMTSQDFFADVSNYYYITKTDAIEIALRMTDEDYCIKIEESVFDSVEIDLMYNAIDYIDKESANIGSEGIDIFEVTDRQFVRGERIDRVDGTVIYEFVYNIKIEGTSYEYLGRDEETKEIFRSDGRDHVFEGQIIVQVAREVEVFYDFENDNSYDKTEIVGGKLEEINFSDKPTPPGEFGYCPICGEPLNLENDGGSGFCVKCTQEYDK